MKKSISIFISLLLCLPLLLCGAFFVFNINFAKAEEIVVPLYNNEDFIRTINEYNSTGDAGATRTYILQEDIDVSSLDGKITGMFGTASLPFAGTFDGNGHTISNLNINITLTADSNTFLYAGLFGYTNGATIKNLHISGLNINITINGEANNSLSSVYAGLVGFASNTTISNTQISGNYSVDVPKSDELIFGGLVGQANNTTIENCYITSSMSIDVIEGYTEDNEAIAGNFNMLTYGGLVGQMNNSTLKNAIVRPTSAINLNLSNIYRTTSVIGGVVGNLNSSSVQFVLGAQNLNVDIDENYNGNTFIGGIAGYLSQGETQIINSIYDGVLTIDDGSGNASIGYLGGYISSPAPSAYNLSYDYYYRPQNSTYNAFGYYGNYSLRDNEAYIISQSVRANSTNYFEDKDWNELYGDWNFTDDFIIRNNVIYLQAFEDNFTLRTEVDEFISITEPINDVDESGAEINFRYGDTASFSFQFSNIESGVSDETFSNYYELTNITLDKQNGSETVVTFFEQANASGEGTHLEPRVTSNFPNITAEYDEDTETYTITINGITMNYAGTYSVNIEPIHFTGNFEYRLFDEEGQLDNESDEMKTECYVYYTNGENRNDPSVQIRDMVYGNRYSISTSARTNSLYSFTGWCIVHYDDEGNETSTEEIAGATNRDLSFTFGQGVFTDNFTVYARYDYNACNFNFILGDGIEQIVLSSRSEPITTTDTTVPLLKQLTSITMDVYVRPNSSFDVQRFMDSVNTFDLENPEAGFCALVENYPITLEDGTTQYQFTLNLNNLSTDNEDSFTLTFNTEEVHTTDWTLVWILVGSIGGGLLLIGGIILIVFLVKRRGGRGGGGSLKKSSYKNMYY